MPIILGTLGVVLLGMIVHHFTMNYLCSRNDGFCENNSSKDHGVKGSFKMNTDEDITIIIKYLVRERLQIGSEVILKPIFHHNKDPFMIGIFHHGYQIGWIDDKHPKRAALYELLVKKTPYTATCIKKEFSKGELILNNPFGIHEPRPEVEIDISIFDDDYSISGPIQLMH